MSTEILKEFLIAVGFKTDESSYKRASDAIDGVEKKVAENDRRDRQRVTEEGKRHEVRKRNAEGLALALGGVATAAAAAATVVGAAMVKIAGGFDNLYFVSQRTGASVNNLKGIGYAFSQVGSSAESAMQAIESFAKARRTNPGINAMLRSMGVDTRGDTADVLVNSIDTIQRRHPYYTGAQVAGLLGISEDQFQTLTKYREQIKAYREEYARTQRALNVNSDDTARASATIQRAVGSLTATLGVLSEKLYTILAPVLERIVKGFKDWVESHPEQVEKLMQGVANAAEAVGNALTRLGDWLADEKNQKTLADYWDKFVNRVSETAKQIKDLIEMLLKLGRFLGLGPSTADDPLGIGHAVSGALGTGGGSNGQGTAGEQPGILKRGMNAIRRAFGGGSAEANTSSSGGDLTAKPGSKADIRGATFDAKAPGIMKRLMEDFGLSKDEAAIVLGNLGTESDGFRAFEEYGGGPGRGWAQWTQRDRKRRFFEYAQRNGLDPKSDEANYGFLRWELENTHARAIDRLKRGRTYGDKMYAFEAEFEGAGVKNYDSRFRYARRAQEAYDRVQSRPPVMAATPRMNFTPGGFNVDDYLRSLPMGASSSTDNSRSAVMNSNVNVTVNGATDPQATASAVTRGVGTAHDMSLRNVQTAIR